MATTLDIIMKDLAAVMAKAKPKSGLVRIRLDGLHVAPENDKVYRPIPDSNPTIVALAASISRHGIKEPLVVSADRYILSGHRRAAAARLAGLDTVLCRVEPISREDEPDRFLVLLTEYNRQREKSLDEKVREAAIAVRPEDAYATLVEERKTRSKIAASALEMGSYRARAAISDARTVP